MYEEAEIGSLQIPKPMTQFEYQDAANDHARAQCGARGAAIETVARRPQRRFTAADKLRILQAAEIASASGKRGAIGGDATRGRVWLSVGSVAPAIRL